MLQKTPLDDGRVKVTFKIPDGSGADAACVVGDFNDWSHEATPMLHEEGSFVVELALRPGRSYRFRYLLDGVRWENDWQADRYVDNNFGGNDSVVDIT